MTLGRATGRASKRALRVGQGPESPIRYVQRRDADATLHKLYRRQRKLEWLSNRQGPSTAKYRHPAECADLIAENDLDEPVVRHWLLAPRAHSFDIVGHHGFRAGPCQVPAVALALWRSGFIIASVATTLIIVACGTIPNFC